MGLSGDAIGTYRLQYRPLSAIRYLDVNPLSIRYTLFSTLLLANIVNLVSALEIPVRRRPESQHGLPLRSRLLAIMERTKCKMLPRIASNRKQTPADH
jgi:hypothetical protein